ncbi:MAG: thioredoxin TrxC [Deltaproteobacteria bacterium]|nr:thioredoxin TrxC [Sandaracinaceae bacterium]MCX7807870.1 thioredoxin TrxC [Deltaproteobacteria bacterium]MDW8245692.1 thioredoxin TrxC [Sandaracinaceae bacterium]
MVITCRSCGTHNRVPVERLNQGPKCGQCHAPLELDQPIEAASAEEFDEIVGKSPLPVLVDFWAPWCAPCRIVAPELKKIAKSHAGRLVVLKLNADEVPEVANRFHIQAIPTFILFRDGKVVSQQSGAMPAAHIVKAFGL